jgi:tRNA threonylcarbamoyladenosine biosynthesis protein TsaE
MSIAIPLPDEAATAAVAARLAAVARAGDVFCLAGELGAGKTTLVRGFLRACGVAGEVPSPTFNLVLTYDVRLPSGKAATVWHVDLYRLDGPDDLAELGLEEAMAEGVVFVEWPDRLGPLRPAEAIGLTIEADEGGRRLTVDSADPRFGSLAG